MTVIARCKTCCFESIIREGETITNACGCPLRADWPGWEFTEMVPASQLAGAVDDLNEALALLRNAQPGALLRYKAGWTEQTAKLLARRPGGQ